MKHRFDKPFRAFLVFMFVQMAAFASSSVTVSTTGTFPGSLSECSGLDFNGGSHFWTHNDGYGDNNLYKVDMSGNVVQTVAVTNAVNFDWEDVTHDAGYNYLYIGDFGNNNCDRTNLRVYRTAYPHTSTGSSTTAEVINFSYPDQHCFPSPWMNFDVEAFVSYNGKLFLFTKTDGNAVGYTKLYSLPSTPGTYVATLVDSFYTNDRTTSATVSPDGSSLVIISNSHIHLFRNWSGDDFFNGDHTQIQIAGSWTQKEGVSFYSNQEIYLSDEDNGSGNHLYYLNLAGYIPNSVNSVAEESRAEISVQPNPASEFVTFNSSGKNFKKSEIRLFDLTGKLVFHQTFSALEQARINVSEMPEGIYIYKFIGDGNEIKTARIVVSR